MDDKRIDLPQWVIERMEAAYEEELLEIKSDPEVSCMSLGFYGSELRAALFVRDEEVMSRIISLETLCYEPAECWASSGVSDQYHYDIIGEIARKLREQSDRLLKVQQSLQVREP